MASWDYVSFLLELNRTHGSVLVVVGDSSTGKSSLLVQLTDKRFLGQSDPTHSIRKSNQQIGVEFGASIISLPNGKTIKAQVWDTAGYTGKLSVYHPVLCSSNLKMGITFLGFFGGDWLLNAEYRGAAGALLVFDTTYRKSFMNLSQWLEDLKSYGDPDLTVVVVGNKSDLCQSTSDNPDSTASLSRQVTHEEALSWAEERGLEYIETSAKTGDNVEEAFAKIARKIYESGRLALQNPLHQQRPGASFPLSSSTTDRKQCCG
ncbi:hypothetical protein VP01_308g7 [Puccinia sorghi]|uniref:Uncharacterized protein n=1 Tax=Puccinia sorghi TaxID=27349 RepID=A0A0L6UZJ5_9BASI|nr:hypothetical protein VP01_308g7 [Puccinia sorghi]